MATLRYFRTGVLRQSPRHIEDAPAEIGVVEAEMRRAVDALVAAGLLVSQETLDEEPDLLTGHRGRVLRLTLAGQHKLDSKP